MHRPGPRTPLIRHWPLVYIILYIFVKYQMNVKFIYQAVERINLDTHLVNYSLFLHI